MYTRGCSLQPLKFEDGPKPGDIVGDIGGGSEADEVREVGGVVERDGLWQSDVDLMGAGDGVESKTAPEKERRHMDGRATLRNRCLRSAEHWKDTRSAILRGAEGGERCN